MSETCQDSSEIDLAAAAAGMVAAARGTITEHEAEMPSGSTSMKRQFPPQGDANHDEISHTDFSHSDDLSHSAKKHKSCDDILDPDPAPVTASHVGITDIQDNDVLSGRGGGTNVHPGNRFFRDLISMHRRTYLKARKNDKPDISRMIVRAIRQKKGRFLKREDATGLWYEIGDDAAREKTSQALRQRAPEMRKILFETEREEARAQAAEQFRQQFSILSHLQPTTNEFVQAMTQGNQLTAGLFPPSGQQPNTNGVEMYAPWLKGANVSPHL